MRVGTQGAGQGQEFDTAKNGLWLDLPYRARCVADDRGMHPAEVAPR